MDLTEQILIKKDHKLWKELDDLCLSSKNLYNQGLYRLNKEYEDNKKYKNYNKLDKELRDEQQVDYNKLPQKVAQQTLMLLDKIINHFLSPYKIIKRTQVSIKDVLDLLNINIKQKVDL